MICVLFFQPIIVIDNNNNHNQILLDQMSVTHCIFDLDGLLLDTESIYTECLQKLCAPYGKSFTTEVKLKMMGKSSLEAGKILIRSS